jgi:hypothetical protein
VVQAVEDVQGLPPGAFGGLEVAVGVVPIGEMGQRVSLARGVAEFAAQADRPAVAGSSVAVMTQMVMGVTEAVPRGRLLVP